MITYMRLNKRKLLLSAFFFWPLLSCFISWLLLKVVTLRRGMLKMIYPWCRGIYWDILLLLPLLTTTAISPLLPRYPCERTKVPPGRTTTYTLKMTRATSSSVPPLAWSHRTLQVGGGEQGWVYGETWMRRDLGQWDRRKRMVEGGERSGLPAGRRAWSPGFSTGV